MTLSGELFACFGGVLCEHPGKGRRVLVQIAKRLFKCFEEPRTVTRSMAPDRESFGLDEIREVAEDWLGHRRRGGLTLKVTGAPR